MKLPFSWLSDYIDIPNVSNRDFAEKLSIFGSKVENITKQGQDIINVVTGKIISIKAHPDADKLCICSVDIANDTIQIVTGANNISVGDIVPVALHKSTLPGGVKIKSGKLRGEISNGMMCSYQELGLSHSTVPYADENGILILPNNTAVGVDIRDVFNLNETIVEFEITSNRPDCFGVYGLALETAAAFKIPLKDININDYTNCIDDKPLKINLQNDNCLRYMAKIITDVKIAPSPNFIQERLKACGVRPINNIVDITNYVMLELSQPMHAFNFTNTINIRLAKNNEKILALDGNEYTLQSDMLVIADDKNPIAIAGIMGGENSGVSDKSTKIILECANFSADSVRNTSKKLALRSDSSSRFEKGLNPNMTKLALNRACTLIQELGFGTVLDTCIDIYKNPIQAITLPLQVDKINKLLGTNISKSDMISMLETLKFKIVDDIITVPDFRTDISGNHDICEEIARMFGYDNIIAVNNIGSSAGGALSKIQKFERDLSEKIRAFGFSETYTHTLISPKAYEKINLTNNTSCKIINPLGEDFSILRLTAIPSLLESLSTNYNVRNPCASLFEIAMTYKPSEDLCALVGIIKQPTEEKVVTLASFGEFDFLEFKGILENILINTENISYKKCSNNSLYHSGRCGEIFSGKECIGVFGEIHPTVLQNYNIAKPVLAIELNFNELFHYTHNEAIYKPIPKFPAMLRDIALLCDIDLEAGKILSQINSINVSILENVSLFDVYTGDRIQDGKKSLAFSLTFRVLDRTLTDEECDAAVAKILKCLKDKLNVELR